MAGTAKRVVMPQLGESVHEGTISKWLVKPGDKVTEFEPMLEVDTDKVSAEVPAPVTGILKEILAKEGQTVQAGAEIAVVEVGGDGEVQPLRRKRPRRPQPQRPRPQLPPTGRQKSRNPQPLPNPRRSRSPRDPRPRLRALRSVSKRRLCRPVSTAIHPPCRWSPRS